MEIIDLHAVWTDTLNFPWELLDLTRPSTYVPRHAALARAAAPFATGRGERTFLMGSPTLSEMMRAAGLHDDWKHTQSAIAFSEGRFSSNEEAVLSYLRYVDSACAKLKSKLEQAHLNNTLTLPDSWLLKGR